MRSRRHQMDDCPVTVEWFEPLRGLFRRSLLLLCAKIRKMNAKIALVAGAAVESGRACSAPGRITRYPEIDSTRACIGLTSYRLGGASVELFYKPTATLLDGHILRLGKRAK
jgi:hypothetical protein